MRAAQIENDVVVNFAEVNGFNDQLLDPLDSVVGSTWDGTKFTPPAVPPLTEQQYTDHVQAHLDSTARSRNYDNILSACTYASSSVAKFAGEGKACLDWRDACWNYCYQAMADVQNNVRPAPTLDGLIQELPVIQWP